MSNSVILKFTFKMFFEYWYVGLRMFILLFSWFSFVLISFPIFVSLTRLSNTFSLIYRLLTYFTFSQFQNLYKLLMVSFI